MKSRRRSLVDEVLKGLGKKVDFAEDASEYLNRNRSFSAPYQISHASLFYTIHPGVFAPDLFEDTFFFMDVIPWRLSGSFLEIGCGAGLISIKAALRNYDRVLATDISQAAINNCIANVRLHSLESIVETRESDVFSNIDPREKFDQIFWNLPFIWTDKEPDDDLEATLYDLHYRGLKSFLRAAREHANPEADILLGFSDSSGQTEAVNVLADEQGFAIRTVAEKCFDDGFNLQLLKFE